MQKLQNYVATVVVLVLVLMLVVGLGFGFSCGRLLLVTIFLLYQISFCPTFHPSMFVISMSNSPQKMLLNEMTPAGLEPAIPGSVGRCLIRWATGPVTCPLGRLQSSSALQTSSQFTDELCYTALRAPDSLNDTPSALKACYVGRCSGK